MSNRALLVVALGPIVFAACSMPNSGELEEHASSSSRVPPPWMEVRDYDPEKPVIVDTFDELAGGLPRANFSQEIPFEYTTYFKGRWTTNGAAIHLKSGKTLNVPGSIVQWYHVD